MHCILRYIFVELLLAETHQLISLVGQLYELWIMQQKLQKLNKTNVCGKTCRQSDWSEDVD